jgi:hypothetical protein
MNDQQSDDHQRRDALLLRLLKMPPKSRAEFAEAGATSEGEEAYSDSREAGQAGETQSSDLRS